MVRNLRDGDAFPLAAARYGVALSWDAIGQSRVDVDLQAVIVNPKGEVIDAVYYNNLKALRAITHSGDETTGEKSGYDEMVWVDFGKLEEARNKGPEREQVKLIIFAVAAYQGGHLRDAQNGKVHILQMSKENKVADFPLEQSEEEVDVVAIAVRSEEGAWSLRVLEEAAQDGQHFMDILEPTIGNIVRREIPGAPKRLKVAFAMQKGAVVDLPQSSAVKHISAGLGWDTGKGNVDLDVSAVLYDADCGHKATVFFGNLSEQGIQHSGDNLTGEGAGDDETIKVDLETIPESVHQIFFLVNIYSKGKTFELVDKPYCRILDSTNAELARYELREAGKQNGLVIARLFREGSGLRWGFQAIGSFCRGQTWKDSLGDVAPLCRMRPTQLQLGGASTASLPGCCHQEPAVAAFAAHPPSAPPRPPPRPPGGACALS